MYVISGETFLHIRYKYHNKYFEKDLKYTPTGYILAE